MNTKMLEWLKRKDGAIPKEKQRVKEALENIIALKSSWLDFEIAFPFRHFSESCIKLNTTLLKDDLCELAKYFDITVTLTDDLLKLLRQYDPKAKELWLKDQQKNETQPSSF